MAAKDVFIDQCSHRLTFPSSNVDRCHTVTLVAGSCMLPFICINAVARCIPVSIAANTRSVEKKTQIRYDDAAFVICCLLEQYAAPERHSASNVKSRRWSYRPISDTESDSSGGLHARALLLPCLLGQCTPRVCARILYISTPRK